MTATKPETNVVEALTDKAIVKRIAQISRMIATRRDSINTLESEVGDLDGECASLLKTQIARLTAQLPAEFGDKEQS